MRSRCSPFAETFSISVFRQIGNRFSTATRPVYAHKRTSARWRRASAAFNQDGRRRWMVLYSDALRASQKTTGNEEDEQEEEVVEEDDKDEGKEVALTCIL